MPRRRTMGSITWGTKSRLGLIVPAPEVDLPARVVISPSGFITAAGAPAQTPVVSTPIFSTPPIVIGPTLPFPTSPTSTAPGTVTANGLPGQVPVTSGGAGTVVVSPSSGVIPDPSTVAAGTTAATSWFEQQMIAGIPNWWLLAGAGVLFLMHNSGGKKR